MNRRQALVALAAFTAAPFAASSYAKTAPVSLLKRDMVNGAFGRCIVESNNATVLHIEIHYDLNRLKKDCDLLVSYCERAQTIPRFVEDLISCSPDCIDLIRIYPQNSTGLHFEPRFRGEAAEFVERLRRW